MLALEEDVMKFLVMIPWSDLAEDESSEFHPRVTFGTVEAPKQEDARWMVGEVMADEGALVDLLIEPGTAREVAPAEGTGSLAEYGITVGAPIILLVEELGGLDLDWAMSYGVT